MPVSTITAGEFANRYSSRLPLIDVRTPAEHDSQHVIGAICHPLLDLNVARLEQTLKERGFGADDEVYLLCQGGKRAQMAAERIAGESSLRLVVVEGGTLACVQAGVPIKQGQRSAISIERQVRIAAGSLVLLGVILGALVSPAWYVLSGFVGAGLTFAGITDTCMMGLLLMRMPWNKA